MPAWRDRLEQWARALKREVMALWFTLRDPGTPWAARLLIALVVGYALSPIDLIPDFIPVLGYLDDALLLPALIWLAVRLIPPPVLAANRARAAAWFESRAQRPSSRAGAVAIVLIWIVAAALLWAWLR